MQEEIRALAAERDAVILAHNYQVPEVQDVADYVGDSLGLSRQAAATDADAIVFCGVHFMAETAAILCPDKTVLIPDLDAGCSLAASITADQLRAWKAEHPGAVVVSYVNTTAEVKAESDYCCTSGNAKAVIDAIPADREILFLPDMFLGLWLEKVTGRKLRIWMGECHVHAGIRPQDITRWQAEAPDAELLVHPECGCASQCMAFGNEKTHILSTEGMINFAKAVPEGALPRRDRDRDPPPAVEGGARQALRGGLREGDLPLHEDDHAAEAARLAARLEVRGDGARRDRRAGARRDRPDGRHLVRDLTRSGAGVPRAAVRRRRDDACARRLAAVHRRLGGRRRRGRLGQHRLRAREAAQPRPRPADLARRRRPEDPYRWLKLAGTATLVDEGADAQIDRLSKKYTGREVYASRQPGEQRVSVRIYAGPDPEPRAGD